VALHVLVVTVVEAASTRTLVGTDDVTAPEDDAVSDEGTNL
jgi:hypothetical protein